MSIFLPFSELILRKCAWLFFAFDLYIRFDSGTRYKKMVNGNLSFEIPRSKFKKKITFCSSYIAKVYLFNSHKITKGVEAYIYAYTFRVFFFFFFSGKYLRASRKYHLFFVFTVRTKKCLQASLLAMHRHNQNGSVEVGVIRRFGSYIDFTWQLCSH